MDEAGDCTPQLQSYVNFAFSENSTQTPHLYHILTRSWASLLAQQKVQSLKALPFPKHSSMQLTYVFVLKEGQDHLTSSAWFLFDLIFRSMILTSSKSGSISTFALYNTLMHALSNSSQNKFLSWSAHNTIQQRFRR